MGCKHGILFSLFCFTCNRFNVIIACITMLILTILAYFSNLINRIKEKLLR